VIGKVALTVEVRGSKPEVCRPGTKREEGERMGEAKEKMGGMLTPEVQVSAKKVPKNTNK
jgi:hypothetical protein